MRRKKTLSALLLILAVILCASCLAEAESAETPRDKLYVYLEGNKETFEDKKWLNRIADVISGAAFLYDKPLSIEIYKVSQSWNNNKGKPILLGTYNADSTGYSAIQRDLTGNVVADNSRNQKNSEKLFSDGIDKMIKIVQDTSGKMSLFVFSDSAYKTWYPAPGQEFLSMVVISKDAEEFDASVISDAMNVSALDLAVSAWKQWTGAALTLARADNTMKMTSSQFVTDRKILAEGSLTTEGGQTLGRQISSLTLYAPDIYGFDGEIHAEGAIAALHRKLPVTLSIDISQASIEKGKPVAFLSHLLNDADKSEMETKEWTATAYLLDEWGKVVDQTAAEPQYNTFSGSFTIQNGGKYSIRLEVSNPAWFEETLSTVSDPFEVMNQPPTVKTDAEMDLPIWIADGDTGDYVFELKPEEYWSDDNPISELKYELAEKKRLVDINGSTLYIHKAFLEKQETIAVLARDAEKAASAPITIQIRPLRVDEVFKLNCTLSPEPGEDGKYAKFENISVAGNIEAVETNIPVYESNWKVHAELVDSKGSPVRNLEAEMTGTQYQLSFDMDQRGEYTLRLSAENTGMEGWNISNEASVRIRNTKPTFTGTAENLSMDVWTNSIVEKEDPFEINLADYFEDDSDNAEKNVTGNLHYKLDVQECPGIVLEENGMLKVDSETLEKSWDLNVIVSDDEDEKDVQPLQIHRQDIPTLLMTPENWKAELKWLQKEDQKDLYKDTPLEIQASMTFEDQNLRNYWTWLGDAAEGFEGFPVTLKLVSSDEAEETVLQTKQLNLKWNQDEECFSGSVVFDRNRKAGHVSVTASMSEQLAGETIQSRSVSIVERTPVVSDEMIETTILIPGPWVLNANLQVQSYDMQLEKIVEVEVLDELKVQIKGLTDGKLHKLSETEYIYTDSQNTGGDVCSEAIWIPGGSTPFVLQLESIQWGEHDVEVTVSDREESNGQKIRVHLTVEYKNQKALIIAGAVLAFLLLAAIVALIIRQITKPAFDMRSKVQLEVLSDSKTVDKKDVWICGWKKKKVSLRDILIQSGISIIGEIPMGACDKIFLFPAKAKNGKAGFYLRNGASQDDVQLYLGQNAQAEKKIQPQENEPVVFDFQNTDNKLILNTVPDDVNRGSESGII